MQKPLMLIKLATTATPHLTLLMFVLLPRRRDIRLMMIWRVNWICILQKTTAEGVSISLRLMIGRRTDKEKDPEAGERYQVSTLRGKRTEETDLGGAKPRSQQ
jgi:hypothetical protein